MSNLVLPVVADVCSSSRLLVMAPRGENVHANKAHRAVKLDDDRVDIQMREGENTILLKID